MSSRALRTLHVAHAGDSSLAKLDGLGQGPPPDPAPAGLEVRGEPFVQLTPSPLEKHQARGAARAQEGLAVDVPEQRSVGAFRGLVEDGDGERVPEQPPRGRALAVAAKVVRKSQAGGLPPETDGQAEAQRVEPHAPGHAQTEQSGQQMEGSGQAGAREGRLSLVVHVVDAEVVLHVQEGLGPRAMHEVEGRAVACDHQVRAVVHVFAG